MKKCIGLLLFTSLMLIKVSGFHAYSHQDCDSETIENCNICELALENQSLDIQASDIFDSVEALEFPKEKQNILEDNQFDNQLYNLHLFSRPPPSLMV